MLLTSEPRHISPHCAIVTSRSGTSLPRRPVLVASILRTTSMLPSPTTRPNTTCLASRKGVGTVVMKNCEPFVLGPAFYLVDVSRVLTKDASSPAFVDAGRVKGNGDCLQ